MGLRLAAAKLAFDGTLLSFDLLLAFLIPARLRAAFRRPERAIVCVLEDSGGRAAAFAASDPHVAYPDEGMPNFVGLPPALPGDPLDSQERGGWAGIPLRVSLPRPSEPGPSLFVTALLREYVSNTLAIDLGALSATSFLDGRPSPVRTMAEKDAEIAAAPPIVDEGGGRPEPEDEPAAVAVPAPAAAPRPAGSPAFELTARKVGPHGPSEPILLDGKLTLSDAEYAPLGSEGWLRAAFVCAIPEEGETAPLASLAGDRVVFPDEGAPGPGGRGRIFTFALDLDRQLGARLPPGRWFVQLSARHHRSSVLEIVRG